MTPTPFIVIGGAGWRAQFFLRAARALPDLFRVSGILVRDREKVQKVQSEWGVPTSANLDELFSVERPKFAVVSVARIAAPQVLMALAERGIASLCETPPGPNV